MIELRALVKTDMSTIQEISKEVGLHFNTITRLIKPGSLHINSKSLAAANKLAARYGKRVEVIIKLVDIE